MREESNPLRPAFEAMINVQGGARQDVVWGPNGGAFEGWICFWMGADWNHDAGYPLKGQHCTWNGAEYKVRDLARQLADLTRGEAAYLFDEHRTTEEMSTAVARLAEDLALVDPFDHFCRQGDTWWSAIGVQARLYVHRRTVFYIGYNGAKSSHDHHSRPIALTSARRIASYHKLTEFHHNPGRTLQ